MTYDAEDFEEDLAQWKQKDKLSRWHNRMYHKMRAREFSSRYGR